MYSLAVHSLTSNDDIVAASCDVSVSKDHGEKTVVELNASYIFAFKTDTRDEKKLKQIAIQCAAAVIWPRFDDLFGVMANQAYLQLPRLPGVPKYTEYVERSGGPA